MSATSRHVSVLAVMYMGLPFGGHVWPAVYTLPRKRLTRLGLLRNA
jgi:hypothetical protein